ncbi:hypothetical protein ACJJTC_011952 [Scirpophaga incertulas]
MFGHVCFYLSRRGLTPPHRVKSISMATFHPDEIEFIRSRGNDYCRRVWLGLYEGESANFMDEQSIKDFMSDKYEKKRYYLEPQVVSVVNGNSSTKNNTKLKTNNTTPLISISPQTAKNSTDDNVVANISNTKNFMTNFNDNTTKLARPVVNYVQPTANNTIIPTSTIPPPIPDFPVDFSTANIYNSSQVNNVNNNNFWSQSVSAAPTTNMFSTTTSSNDRYAALADLDLALRQQNMKNIEGTSSVNNKNPFQSTATEDVFVNKNPFFNGGWSTTSSVPMNPFTSSTNGSCVNSNNPFL